MIKSIRNHLEGSMDLLQTEYVDIYYLHRMSGVPVEKVAEAMGRLMEDGLIRGWGLSQQAAFFPERSHHRRSSREMTMCGTDG